MIGKLPRLARGCVRGIPMSGMDVVQIGLCYAASRLRQFAQAHNKALICAAGNR